MDEIERCAVGGDPIEADVWEATIDATQVPLCEAHARIWGVGSGMSEHLGADHPFVARFQAALDAFLNGERAFGCPKPLRPADEGEQEALDRLGSMLRPEEPEEF